MGSKDRPEDRPEGLSEFLRLMAASGPYEASPVLAVGVSGGGDSMALVLLADQWARARGGKVIALTVDHGLRDGSAGEARQVGEWLSRRHIDHHILVWSGPKPTGAIQARARSARYALMEDWCHQQGILHLLLAHTAGDQAETFLMRLEKGSGPDGLSAMSVVSERKFCRLVRPLLSVSGSDLRTYLRACNQPWVEDPSNQNLKFDRIRWRNMLAGQNISPGGFCLAAERYGRARTVLGGEVARLMATFVSVDPSGFMRISRSLLSGTSEELAERVLARVLMAVGALPYPPRRRKTSALLSDISRRGFKSRTLGRCRIIEREDTLLIVRELRLMPGPVRVTGEERMVWDNRFDLAFRATSGEGALPRSLAPLGDEGWKEVVAEQPELHECAVPAEVRLGLPALFDEDGVFSVPQLGYKRVDGGRESRMSGVNFDSATFRPLNSLSGARYLVAY